MASPKVSVIIPIYNEGKNIPILYRELVSAFKSIKVSHELIFVNDGSSDNSLSNLEKICAQDKKINASIERVINGDGTQKDLYLKVTYNSNSSNHTIDSFGIKNLKVFADLLVK